MATNDYGLVTSDDSEALDKVFTDIAENTDLQQFGWTRQDGATSDGDKFMFLHDTHEGVLEVTHGGVDGEQWTWGYVTTGMEYDFDGFVTIEEASVPITDEE